MLSVNTIVAYQHQLLCAMEPVIETINDIHDVTEEDGVTIYIGLICALLIQDEMTMMDKRHRYRLMLETIATCMHDDLHPDIAPEWESNNDQE